MRSMTNLSANFNLLYQTLPLGKSSRSLTNFIMGMKERNNYLSCCPFWYQTRDGLRRVHTIEQLETECLWNKTDIAAASNFYTRVALGNVFFVFNRVPLCTPTTTPSSTKMTGRALECYCRVSNRTTHTKWVILEWVSSQSSISPVRIL